MIRVIVIDDHALVRELVSRLIDEESGLRVVGAFADGSEAVRFAARDEPHVAILDVAMPCANGIDVARRLRAVSPKTRILMLSMHAKPDYVRQALAAGASGYVLKESAGAEVVAAVRTVQRGERYLSARLAALPSAAHADDPLGRLSAREMQVLKLVVEGNTSNEVAAQLRLSPKSVDTYRSRLMTKLDVEHLPELVKFAIRRGLTSA
jgi:two-component system, NarL family, response regulator NreC